jgi:hypothetical protein
VYKKLMLELAREIQGYLEEEARGALESGWAEMRLVEGAIGPTLHLEPVKLESAPIEIYFDSDQLVVCSPGRNGLVCEFFSEEPGGMKDRVQAIVAAVVSGSYSERLRERSTEMVAEWPGPNGTEQAKRSPLGALAPSGGGWRTVTYEPY